MDEQLREIERLARAGDEEAEVRLLRARVRSGELPVERLWLAAFLQHPAARRAVDVFIEPAGSGAPWRETLAAWGSMVFPIVGLGAVVRRTASEGAESQGLTALRAWCEQATLATTRAVKQAAKTLPEGFLLSACELVPLALDGKLSAVSNRTWELLQATRLRESAWSFTARFVLEPSYRGEAYSPSARLAVQWALLDPRREARVLRRRVGSQGLDEDQLRRAAFLGDEAARLALGRRGALFSQGLLWALGGESSGPRAALELADELLAAHARKRPALTELAAALSELRSEVSPSRSQAIRAIALRASSKRGHVERVAAAAMQWALHDIPGSDFVTLAERAFTRSDLQAVLRRRWVPELLALDPADHEASEGPTGWRGDATPGQLSAIQRLWGKTNMDEAALVELLDGVACKDAPQELEREEARDVIKALQAHYTDTLLRRLGLHAGDLWRIEEEVLQEIYQDDTAWWGERTSRVIGRLEAMVGAET